MAAIRHALQHEVFQPCDERLLAFVHVSKAFKKKKTSFLCVSVTKETPLVVNIYQVKKTDRNAMKKKRSWSLNNLTLVDGKTDSAETHEFDLHFDKVYKWYASNIQERQCFLIVLWKQCSSYSLKERPEFKNLPKEWISGELSPSQTQSQVTALTGEVEAEGEDYQALTEREEMDLEQLMTQCGSAVSNAEAFMEVLARDLSVLDGENVQSVLASEKQVAHLMEQLEVAITEVERVESQLNGYDNILCHIRNTMDKMEEKNMLIEVANRNNQKLLTELERVIFQLELPKKHQNALEDADLTTKEGLRDAIAAGKALQAVMNAEIHPALVRLAAVQEQKKRFDKWKSKFSQIISRNLNNLFIHLGNDAGEQTATLLTLPKHTTLHRELTAYTELMHWCKGNDAGEQTATLLTLPKHTTLHRELTAYTELMHWCKVMDRKAFTALTKVYTSCLGKIYERDIHQFLEDAKLQISGANTLAVGKEDKLRNTNWGLLGVERDQWGTECDPSERLRFDHILEKVLAQLEPVCLSEQNFCVSFFQLDVLSPTTKNTQTTLDGLATDNRLESDMLMLPQKRIDKQVNEEVRRMMTDIFGCIEPELVNFINYHEKLDSMHEGRQRYSYVENAVNRHYQSYCMYALVRFSQHVMSAQDTGSFLSMTFGSVLVQVKRNYDRYMQAQLRSIHESKVNRKSKCGILPFVANFEEFANHAEVIFKDTERRADLDKWYVKLVAAMFEVIPSVATDHHKTPSEVVKMENFHHMFSLLSQLKISVLDTHKKEAKQKYNDALKAYVTRYFGRPLEKLNQFFDGVQAKVAQGVKESEISYQMAFSKQELRKVIREYPGREVRKGLNDLYKKVEKHLCEEENLLQVVWRAMQEEFIQQYKYIENLIQRCYPGSMITLDFSIEDILQFFSEIARSH